MAPLIAIATALGCTGEQASISPIDAPLRHSIRQNLAQLGAQITSDDAAGLYASLRNTHVQVRDMGGAIDGAWRTRRDVQDFGAVNEAVAKELLAVAEYGEFQHWLRKALSPSGPASSSAAYGRYRLNVSRTPLRVVFSPRSPAMEGGNGGSGTIP